MDRLFCGGIKISYKLYGNIASLKPYQKKILERLYRKKVEPQKIVSESIIKSLCEISDELKLQVGVLISRKGSVDYVIVGTPDSLTLPDFGRMRAGILHLRGLRLIHTHIHDEPINNDDIVDLLNLRLDYVGAVSFQKSGIPYKFYGAHLIVDSLNRKLVPHVLEPENPLSLTTDILSLVKSIENELKQLEKVYHKQSGERAILVHVALPRRFGMEEISVEETKLLAESSGVLIVDTVTQKKDKPDPKYFIGKGKLAEINILSMEKNCELLIFNEQLSPVQVKEITNVTDLRVIDRTMLILDIFAQRAKSRDGKIQVELAQLKYRLPRLVKKNSAMSRLVGYIGGRGPGEKKLEIDRRKIKDRIAKLEKSVENLSKRRERTRKWRKSKGIPVVSLVGYTNAGKSTLLNTLTESSVFTCNKLFATLDPTVRRFKLNGKSEILLVDTVGFIHNLPKTLINAFRSTLEEISYSDLILHVVDISDENFPKYIDIVNSVLADMKFDKIPQLIVFNKKDLVKDEEMLNNVCNLYNGIAISAKNRETLDVLIEKIESFLNKKGRIYNESFGNVSYINN